MADALETGSLARIIVGLGNPGEPYAHNRHNVGFLAVEALARESCAADWSTGTLSRSCRAVLCGCPVLLVEPLTYMNNSGKSVQVLLAATGGTPQDFMLIFDDLNLPFGRIRIRERGSSGGHHGLESVMTALNTDEFVRVRMGIGEEQMPADKTEFVLSDFPPERQAELDAMIFKAGNAVKSILSEGVSKTMGLFNG